jgi:enoyl-CoA hydratase/carnithine racemase
LNDGRVVGVARHGSVLVLELRREEKLNAWGADMREQLLAALEDCRRDTSVGAVILTGSGERAFSSGADVSNPATHAQSVEDALEAMATTTTDIFGYVTNFPKPVLGAINGYAIGAGFALAICCDTLIASHNAEFAMPQLKFGVLPGFSSVARLAQWVGRGRAWEIVTTGRRVPAEEALRIGLVSALHSSSDLSGAALVRARELAELSPAAVRLAKESLLGSLEPLLRLNSLTDSYRSVCVEQTSFSRHAHRDWRSQRDQTSRATGEKNDFQEPGDE